MVRIKQCFILCFIVLISLAVAFVIAFPMMDSEVGKVHSAFTVLLIASMYVAIVAGLSVTACWCNSPVHSDDITQTGEMDIEMDTIGQEPTPVEQNV